MAISGSRTSLTWVLCHGALNRASRARTRRPVGALASPKPPLGSSPGGIGWVTSGSGVGTAGAAIELVERAGGTVAGFTVLMELGFLNGRERLAPLTVHALLTV